jgi:hypothetical protein
MKKAEKIKDREHNLKRKHLTAIYPDFKSDNFMKLKIMK